MRDPDSSQLEDAPVLLELRRQLEHLIRLSDKLRLRLERQRDAAARRGDTDAAAAIESGLLQVTRVRNDVWSAWHDLDAASISGPQPPHRTAA